MNEKLSEKDKEILEKLGTTIKLTDEHIENFQFGQALHAIYDFIWRDFADQYIEYSKTNDAEETKQTLAYVLSNILKLLHPFMPFITEEIWSSMPIKDKKPLIIENWPKTDESGIMN
ncbi:MAG: class I tRNA ligase family protein [Patescibacteria group bacterium]